MVLAGLPVLLLALLAVPVDRDGRVGGRDLSVLDGSMARRRALAARVMAASRSRFSGVRSHVAGSAVRPSRYTSGIAAC
ncbi:hypothetical protein [Streptomyces sp. CB02115]|uniref:hypothetical protein n=1 Tax=Streptomyces sp. CB02115 TaxID=1703939 RepID=UPI0009650B7A|nr:hypothetical protein [Streptomyces sp. CB02115]OKJ48892.1 hypothetical protein AMK28_35115 [Streptomyces sp. CB02115]